MNNIRIITLMLVFLDMNQNVTFKFCFVADWYRNVFENAIMMSKLNFERNTQYKIISK